MSKPRRTLGGKKLGLRQSDAHSSRSVFQFPFLMFVRRPAEPEDPQPVQPLSALRPVPGQDVPARGQVRLPAASPSSERAQPTQCPPAQQEDHQGRLGFKHEGVAALFWRGGGYRHLKIHHLSSPSLLGLRCQMPSSPSTRILLPRCFLQGCASWNWFAAALLTISPQSASPRKSSSRR